MTHQSKGQRMRWLLILLLILLLIGLHLGASGPEAARAACTSRVDMTVQRSSASTSVVRFDVTLTPAATVPGGDRLIRVRFVEARGAQVAIGTTVQPVPSELVLPATTTAWSFTVTQTQANAPFLVRFVATDLCGDVPKFVGAGSTAAQPAVPTATPTATPTAMPAPDCSTSLQQRVDIAASGSTLTLPACVFRESVVVSKPLTLVGVTGTEIRGSDVWTGWTRSGAYWTRAGVPSFTGNGFCRVEAGDRCLRREQAFFDGLPLVQVPANPATGQFAVVGGTVYLADDPTGHTIEISTRSSWLRAAASDVTVRGFTMRHAATDAQKGGIANGGFDRLTVQNNVLSDAHGAAISLENGSGHRLLGNQISRSGQEGVHITGVTDVLVQSTLITGSNTEGFDPDWEAGGLKATESTRLTLDQNEVRQNDGPGLWCDLNCTDITITNNRLYQNQRTGILFEISDGAQITGNSTWENGWGFSSWGWGAGIVISTSKNVTVSRNTVAWNADGISVLEQDRGPGFAVLNVTVTDNVIAVSPPVAGSYALGWLSDVSPSLIYVPGASNSGASNVYWTPSPDGGDMQFGWADDYSLLVSFNATPGDEGGRYLTANEKNQLLGGAGIPLTPIAR